MWNGMLHHVQDVHSWALSECQHGPLDDEERNKPWLKAGSAAHNALVGKVLDKRLMRSIPYYITCQTTSELENFNNHILMYASKRQAFRYPVYKARCQLAAIDYSHHLDRPFKYTKEGKQRFKRVYSKKANNWSVTPVKLEKGYFYIMELATAIMAQYCQHYKEEPLSLKVVLRSDDPRLIAPVISPTLPPRTDDLCKVVKSRKRRRSLTPDVNT